MERRDSNAFSTPKWLRLVRDFLWYGLLRRPYQKRLYSPAPTGVMLYELVTSAFKRKR